MQFEKLLSKDNYTENVIRKSLYWMSEYTEWSMNENEKYWIIQFFNHDTSSNRVESIFDRILNDFTLREILDKSTKNMRLKIVSAALNKLAENV